MLFAFPPICLTCPAIQTPAQPASCWSAASIRPARRASFCCRTSIALTRRDGDAPPRPAPHRRCRSAVAPSPEQGTARMNPTAAFDMPPSVSVAQHGDVAVLTLSRPHKRNAIDQIMVRAIDRFFTELPSGSRAVVIRGEGEHFCAGADLSSVGDIDGAAALFHSREAHRVLDRIENCELPVIAVL